MRIPVYTCLIILLCIPVIAEASHKKGVAISGGDAYMCGDEQAFTNVHWW
jgi:hypothetical protein